VFFTVVEFDVGNQLCLPKKIVDQVFFGVPYWLYTTKHLGVMRRAYNIQQRYYWQEMDVTLFVLCFLAWIAKQKKLEKMTSCVQYRLDCHLRKWGSILLFFFVLTSAGNRYSIVVIDYLTNWPFAIALCPRWNKLPFDVLKRNRCKNSLCKMWSFNSEGPFTSSPIGERAWRHPSLKCYSCLSSPVQRVDQALLQHLCADDVYVVDFFL
jgi:hypothetical protein